jgi:5'-methylthioadenosine phosphorylase
MTDNNNDHPIFAIIGGSGLTRLANLEMTRRKVVRTPYGEPSGALTFGRVQGCEVAFLARHGYGHTIPPHEVNYRANIWALQAQQIKFVVSVASVGGIRADLAPGTLVVPDQIIDYTWGRDATFFGTSEHGVTHIDFTHPYCDRVRGLCIEAAQRAGEPMLDGGVYATTQGPRLETAAEVERLKRDGADMVGMTGMPEAVLAREIGLCYGAIAVVTNYAAGRAASRDGISMSGISDALKETMTRVAKIIGELAAINGD